ncbi:cytochrome c oxidase assembly protein [Halomonas llamarensis]|uniref:Cytochrome c oxidase assembly protein CtaG n=1 Tax=Halomonas llamarensis TaxID=2945104 RepID=A0ABT0SSR3_9GAMM|nr:cytochrome c oxidase assembly protein [Halomonas llamarensis]MCL7930827.1 cytochrome c oxidase assembly protein [Halomonas llamarensis]
MQNLQHMQAAGIRRAVIRLLAALLGIFAFALVLMYDVFCRIKGIKGKVNAAAQSIVHEEVDTSRYVNVQFITRGSASLPMQVSVEMQQMRVRPGQTVIDFTFTNNISNISWGRAVSSVSPSIATRYLRKVSCFCFEEQQLQGDERLRIPLVYRCIQSRKTFAMHRLMAPVITTKRRGDQYEWW